MIETRVLEIAERYMRASGIAPSTLGRKAVHNSSVLERIETGRVTVRTLTRLLQYLSDNWPAHLEWPRDVERPQPRDSGSAA